jgi:arylsulfatase A-like enzyme
MTGQLSHNNHVQTIQDGLKINTKDTLQYNLRENGLVTYGVGKYLNGIPLRKLGTDTYDKGFSQSDLWVPDRYYRYDLVMPDGIVYTPAEKVHTTIRTGEGLNNFVETMLDQGDQFYAYAAFMAPHDQHKLHTEEDMIPVPTPANADAPVPEFHYNPEPNTDDKLPIFQKPQKSEAHYEREYDARVRSLFDVDDQLAETFGILKAHGALDNTMVNFVSDNGYQLGRNNWMFKGTPYPSSLKVPMFTYLPGVFEAGKVDERDVSLIDFAPTIYELLGIKPPVELDGHSLLSDYQRQGVFHELSTTTGGDQIEEIANIPTWAQFEEDGQSYIQYYGHGGEVIREEFYTDPNDERNLLYKDFADEAPDRQVLEWFRRQLEKHRSCAGTVESGAANPCT